MKREGADIITWTLVWAMLAAAFALFISVAEGLV